MRISSIVSYTNSQKSAPKKQPAFGRFFGDSMQKAVIRSTIKNAIDGSADGKTFHNQTVVNYSRTLDELEKELYLQFFLNDRGQLVIRRNDRILKEQYPEKIFDVSRSLNETYKVPQSRIVNPSNAQIRSVVTVFDALKHNKIRCDLIYRNMCKASEPLSETERQRLETERFLSYLAE